MIELDGADVETVNRIAWERGSLPVRLAMLGLASIRKGVSPLWWGYPPGVFIGYKWEGEGIQRRVKDFATQIRARGYRVYLDVEDMNADADAYFKIPQFISRLQECSFYVLILTELAADLIDARRNKTSWIHDEVQHAIRLTNAGRLCLVPVLLEAYGRISSLRDAPVLDRTAGDDRIDLPEDLFTRDPLALDAEETVSLGAAMAQFDALFVAERWDAAAAELALATPFEATFDHGFRRMLHALYTADGAAFEATFDKLCAVHGVNIVLHLYRGYCRFHKIPIRIQNR
jgi:hypothetical protein